MINSNRNANTKKCGHCHFDVPSEADVCGYCGAKFIDYIDKSLFGRLYCGFMFSLAGFFFAAIWATIFSSNLLLALIIGGFAMFVYGFSEGRPKYYTVRD